MSAGITDISSGLTVLVPFLILCVVGTVILFQAMPIAASIAGGSSLYNPFPGMVSNASATIGCAGFSLQAGQAAPPCFPRLHLEAAAQRRSRRAAIRSRRARVRATPASYASPAAEQVAGALLATRYAQYRARNGADNSQTET